VVYLARINQVKDIIMGWKEFVSSLTGDSTSKVSEAGHVFRDDSGARENKDSFDKAPDWAPEKTESGIPFFPKGKGPNDDSSEKSEKKAKRN
jgi:hypothetical protein